MKNKFCVMLIYSNIHTTHSWALITISYSKKRYQNDSKDIMYGNRCSYKFDNLESKKKTEVTCSSYIFDEVRLIYLKSP